MIIKMYYIQCSNIIIHSSFSRTAHENDLVPVGKGISDLLVSVLQSSSCSFQRVDVDRPKSSTWPIFDTLAGTGMMIITFGGR